MLRPPAALILVALSLPAFAAPVYRWVDAEGTTHYTDNPASIPKGAIVFATEGEPISEMGKAPPVPVAKPVVIAEAKAAEAAGPAVPTSSEQYWRGQFRTAKEKIKQLEDEIAADRFRTEDPSGLPVGLTYSCAPGYFYVAPAYGSQIVIGPNGVRAYLGQVGQGGYVNTFNNCIQTINPEHDRAKGRLVANRRALERAKEDLHELERRASFDAVPLEWRR